MKAYLHVACNDSNNGLFDGKVRGLSVSQAIDSGEIPILLECHWQEPRCSFTKTGKFRMLGKSEHASTVISGVGNWCWNAYEFHALDIVEWLRLAKRSGKFSLDTGNSELCDWWEGRTQPSGQTLAEWLFK